MTTTTMMPRRLGRPRDLSRDAEILQAAREELSERGYERMTMAAVATRAGAGKATVYRRWASKAEMVIDAVSCTADDALTIDRVPDTGSLPGDLQALRALKHHDEGVWQALAGLVSELPHAPELASVVHERLVRPRVALVRGLLERAARRGELSPDTNLDLLATVPPAMIAYRLLVSGEPIDTDFLVKVSDEIFVPLVTGGRACESGPLAEVARLAAERRTPVEQPVG